MELASKVSYNTHTSLLLTSALESSKEGVNSAVAAAGVAICSAKPEKKMLLWFPSKNFPVQFAYLHFRL